MGAKIETGGHGGRRSTSTGRTRAGYAYARHRWCSDRPKDLRPPLPDTNLDCRPFALLSRIRQQVHDDSALVRRLFDGEEGLAGHPAVLDGLLPAAAAFPEADDHVQAVVPGVERLAAALGPVSEHCERVILEQRLELKQEWGNSADRS